MDSLLVIWLANKRDQIAIDSTPIISRLNPLLWLSASDWLAVLGGLIRDHLKTAPDSNYELPCPLHHALFSLKPFSDWLPFFWGVIRGHLQKGPLIFFGVGHLLGSRLVADPEEDQSGRRTPGTNQSTRFTSKRRCIFTSTVKLHVKTTERSADPREKREEGHRGREVNRRKWRRRKGKGGGGGGRGGGANDIQEVVWSI